MAVTRLNRKDRKNKARANNRQRVIKQLLATPVIKNVDVEALRAQFSNAAPAVTSMVAVNETTTDETTPQDTASETKQEVTAE